VNQKLVGFIVGVVKIIEICKHTHRHKLDICYYYYYKKKKKMSVIFEKIWKKYDVDGDGFLSKQEFGAMARELGYIFSPAELDIAFGLIDSDSSGKIEKPEFKTFWQQDERFARLKFDDEQMVKVKQMADYFHYYDKDNSGELDVKEFKKMCDHMESNGYKLKLMNFKLETLDKNGDGKVNFNEYLSYMIDLGVLDRASDGARPVHG
jgi:Ca2+-binding EF-hand superfamily protein